MLLILCFFCIPPILLILSSVLSFQAIVCPNQEGRGVRPCLQEPLFQVRFSLCPGRCRYVLCVCLLLAGLFVLPEDAAGWPFWRRRGRSTSSYYSRATSGGPVRVAQKTDADSVDYRPLQVYYCYDRASAGGRGLRGPHSRVSPSCEMPRYWRHPILWWRRSGSRI